MDELLVSQIPVSYTEMLPGKREVRRLCRDKICCEFSMRFRSLDAGKDQLKYIYKLTIFSGKERQMDETSKEVYCAVVSCTRDASSSCGKRFQPSDNVVPSIAFEEIKIKMTMELEATQNDYLVMPTNVDFEILPLDTSHYSFERSAVYSRDK